MRLQSNILLMVTCLAACTHAGSDLDRTAPAAAVPSSFVQSGDLPETALGPPIDLSRGYTVIEVADGVWIVTDGIYQAMFASTGEGIVVFDAPQSLIGKLKAAISDTTDEPITHLIYSHSHIDHIGGAFEFDDEVEIISSRQTAEKLERFDDTLRPDPDFSFDGNYTLQVGSLRVEMSPQGDGHEPGNLFMYLPEQRVLMAVDLVYPGWVPFTNLGMAEDIGRYIEDHDELLAFDFDVFVGGHLSRPGAPEDVVIAKTYLKDLIEAAETGRRSTDFYAVGQRVGFEDKWKLVGAYMDDVADVCTRIMLEKWKDRLGGAETSTRGHCWVMQEFLNINGEPGSERQPAQ